MTPKNWAEKSFDEWSAKQEWKHVTAAEKMIIEVGLKRAFLAGRASVVLPDEDEQRKFVDLHFCYSGLEYNSWGYVGKDALELLKKFCSIIARLNAPTVCEENK